MSYQESVITTSNPDDFDKLVERVKQLGKSYYDDCGCYVPSIVTLKKNSRINDNRLAVKAGTKFLYVCGDRSAQRSVWNFLNKYCPADKVGDGWHCGGWIDGEDIEFDFSAYCIFAEYLPRKWYGKDHMIYNGYENDSIKVEEFKF